MLYPTELRGGGAPGCRRLAQLDNANGFEEGVGPRVVMVDEGMAKTTTTPTLKDDIYAFVFGQKGLMAGLGIQGNRRLGSGGGEALATVA